MTAGTWARAGDLPWPRELSGAAPVPLPDGRLFLAGGGDMWLTAQAGAAVFDPAAGTWTETSPMGQDRRMPSVTPLTDGRILVAGGYHGRLTFPLRTLATCEVYDPVAGDWSPTGPLHEARCGHTANLLPDGRVLVAGGGTARSPASHRALSSCEVYDPASGTWTSTGEMVDARAHHPAATLPGGRVLVAGGWAYTRRDWNGGVNLGYCEVYDPATGRWSATGDFAEPRPGLRLSPLPGGAVLATGGGEPGTYPARRLESAGSTRVERYDPATGQWSADRDMPRGRAGHLAVPLPTGHILVLGGTGPPVQEAGYRSADLYDPASRTWSPAAGLATGRNGCAAAPLPDGRVLVAGGAERTGPSTPIGGYHQLTASTEIFTP